MFTLLAKLLDKTATAEERPWLDLLDSTSASMLRENYESKYLFPLHAKVDMYRYRMAAPLWEIAPKYLLGEAVVWWNRTFEEVLIPAVELDPQGQRFVLAQLPPQ
jgi:hypothetical protein